MSEDRLLTDADVADLIGTSRQWVQEAAKCNTIPHLKLGTARRYRRESIDAWLAEIERSGALPGSRRVQAGGTK